MKFIKEVIAVILACFIIVSFCYAEKSTPITIKMGIQPWIGYGPWYIAQEKGLFRKYNLKLELINFVEDKEVNAALASGEMHAANMGNYQAIKLFNAGLDIRIVLAEDISFKADAILASIDIKSISDLKGKKVAYEEGTVSEVLISYALKQNGLSVKDINPIFMPTANAGAALIAKKVDAAVTYEPYISSVIENNINIHLLYTAAEKEGIISDVLVVNESFLKKNPKPIIKLLKVWDEAVSYYNKNPDDAKSIIAKGVESNPDELKTAFDGIVLYDLKDNCRILVNDFRQTLKDVATLYQSIGMLDKEVDIDKLIQDQYLKNDK